LESNVTMANHFIGHEKRNEKRGKKEEKEEEKGEGFRSTCPHGEDGRDLKKT